MNKPETGNPDLNVSNAQNAGKAQGGAAVERSSAPPARPTALEDSATPSARSRMLMSRQSAALVVVDVQEKLIPHIQNNTTVVWNIRRLIDGASILGVTATCTEQYPAGLGSTVPLLADRIQVDDEKSLFSCRDCRNLISRLQQEGRHQILLCGIETHVCVQQTALDLLSMGFDVWVAGDATGSRYDLDHQTALRRMEMAGITVTTTESVLFEWCEVSGTHEFKRISTLVRELPPDTPDIPDARFFPRAQRRYLVQTDHRDLETVDGETTVGLHFLVRNTLNGSVVAEFEGKITRDKDGASVKHAEGVQSVELTTDGTAFNIQHANGEIQLTYLPVGDARTNHPAWKVRRFERHIASEEFQHDYEITFHVVKYSTDELFRMFTGYEHRDPETNVLTHVSGVRQIEISSDGRWMVVTRLGSPPELIELPVDQESACGTRPAFKAGHG